MAHELSFGGVSLTIPTQDVRDLLCRYRFDLQFPFLMRPPAGEFQAAFASRQIALPSYPPDPELVCGRFFYPTGAARWSRYVGVASQSQVDDIEAQLGSGNQMTPLTFVLKADDLTHADNHGGVETPMLLLPPRPLGQTSSTLPREGLYLIVLVDERYLWQFRPAGAIGATALTTWASFLSTLESALSITVSHSSFESVYLSPEPDSDLFSNFETAALLLDAIALNTGRVFVRAFDGTYSFIKPGDATFTRPPTPRYRAFGGDIYDPKESGTVQPWVNAALPESVTVTFPKYQNTSGYYFDPDRPGFFVTDSYGEVYAIPVKLTDIGEPYTQYTGITGVSKVFSDTCKALYTNTDGSGNPTNLTTLTALAQQLAKDYFDQQLKALDEAYTGIRDWTPDPLNDLIFDLLPPKLVQTRVLRKPWDFQVSQMQHHVAATTGGGTVIPGPVTYLDDVTYASKTQTTNIDINYFGAPSYPTYITFNDNSYVTFEEPTYFSACIILAGVQPTGPSSAPTVSVVSTGLGGVPAGTYYTKVTYVDYTGAESTASPEAGPTTVSLDDSELSVGLNNTPSAIVKQWRIYVSDSSGNETRQSVLDYNVPPVGPTQWDVPIATTSAKVLKYTTDGDDPPSSSSCPPGCIVLPVVYSEPSACTKFGGTLFADLGETSSGNPYPVLWLQMDTPTGTNWLSVIGTGTKGDLVVGDADGESTILPIGTDTYVLTVSGGTAVWAPAGGGGAPAFGYGSTTTLTTAVGPGWQTIATLTATNGLVGMIRLRGVGVGAGTFDWQIIAIDNRSGTKTYTDASGVIDTALAFNYDLSGGTTTPTASNGFSLNTPPMTSVVVNVRTHAASVNAPIEFTVAATAY